MTNYQFTVIKYSSGGHQLWVSGYRDIECATGQAQFVALEPSGDIIVAGITRDWSASGSWWADDIATTMRLTPEGGIVWCKREGGASRDFGMDRVDGFCLDHLGNVYLAGRYFGLVGAAISYSPSGQTRWSAEWSSDTLGYRAFGIAHDDSGNTYVSGSVGAPDRWYPWIFRNGRLFIAKLDSTGVREWMYTYGDSARSSVFGRQLMMAGDGNLIFTGQHGSSYSETYAESVQVAKFSPSGQQLWSRGFGDAGTGYYQAVLSPACVLDNAGSLYLILQMSMRWTDVTEMWDSLYTIKLRETGAVEWIRRYQKPAERAGELIGLFVDEGNNLTVGGSVGELRSADIVTTKYQSSGDVLWENHVTGDGYSNNAFSAMTHDGEGNLYVTGSSDDQKTSTDFFVAKFDPAGTEVWRARFNSPENKLDDPDGIAVDATGNVYVTGITRVFDGYVRTTVKYNSLGAQLWSRRSNRGWWGGKMFDPIVIDASGNVVVAGAGGMTTYTPEGEVVWDNDENVHAVAHDRNGAQYVVGHETVARLDSIGRRDLVINITAEAVAVDDSGFIYITRSTGWQPQGEMTAKYSSGGTLVWTYNQGGNRIAVSPEGGVLVRRIPDWPFAQIIKVDRNGNYQWTASTPGTLHGPIDFAVDSTGSLYICGQKPSGLESGSGDFYLARYDTSGHLLWSGSYDSPGFAIETPYGIILDRRGNVTLGGTAEHDDNTNSISIAKFARVTVSVDEERTGIPSEYGLSQNFPNPFNPSTTIRYALAHAGPVELKVFNLLGQEVALLVNDSQKAGYHSVTWNAQGSPSGVYFFRLTAGTFVETRKLVLLR
jgi:hypothetical protein